MVRTMVAGESDAEVLRQLGDPKLRASPEALQERLQGQRTAHHRFRLAGLLEQVTLLDAQRCRLAARLAEQLRPVEAQLKRLDTLDGIDRGGCPELVSRVGSGYGARSRCRASGELGGEESGNDASAGKRRRGKTTKGNKWLRRTLSQAAWAATQRQGGYLSAQYRRLASRRGKKRALVAVGHTILVAASYILPDEVEYHDRGADHCDRRRRERTVSHLVSRLQRLGYNVSLAAVESEAA
jgi:transposase